MYLPHIVVTPHNYYFKVKNSLDFANGLKNMEIEFPANESYKYLITNSVGQTIEEGSSKNGMEIHPSNYLSGTYFLILKNKEAFGPVIISPY